MSNNGLGQTIDLNDLKNAYADLSVNGGSSALALTVQSTWYKADQFDTNGESRDASPDHTSDDITIGTDGTYLIICTFSATADASDTYQGAISVNGSQVGGYWQKITNATPDDWQGAVATLQALSAGDTVEHYVRCTTAAGNTITISDMNLVVLKIGS